jgi:endoglucanase
VNYAKSDGQAALRGSRLRTVLGLLLLAVFTAPAPAEQAIAGSTPRATLSIPAMPAAGSDSKAMSLSVSGNRLVDGMGNTVFLHGVARGSSAYACLSRGSVFSGPSDQASVEAMKRWNINLVWLSINEDCWLGINGAPAIASGANYRSAIRNYVNLLEDNGIYAVLDLAWFAPGSYLSNSHEPLPDADHAGALWSSIASEFADDRAVSFNLAEEPQRNPDGSFTLTWSCLYNGGCYATCLKGGDCPAGKSYAAAGIRQLLMTVRGAEGNGWHHVVWIPGIDSSNTLADRNGSWLADSPADPYQQKGAYVQFFNDGAGSCQTLSCWTASWAAVAAQVPLLAGGFGDLTAGGAPACRWTPILDTFMSFFDRLGTGGYAPWSWDVAACSDPSLVTDSDGTPTRYGAGYKAHLATLP